MRILKDKNNNIFKAQIIDKAPEGFEDITDLIKNPEMLEIRLNLLELELVDEVPAVEGAAEHWTDGTTTVYDANDIPVLTDENGDPYVDPAYEYVEAIEHVPVIPAHFRIKKKAGADQALRERKIEQLRTLREPLLDEADKKINTLEDDGADTAAWRAYRKALRDITEDYKEENGDWKASVDDIDVENFAWPAKP